MSIEKYPRNSIEQRKRDVRVHSRNAVASVATGLIGGAVLGVLYGNFSIFVMGLIFAVAGGAYFYSKVRKILNGENY